MAAPALTQATTYRCWVRYPTVACAEKQATTAAEAAAGSHVLLVAFASKRTITFQRDSIFLHVPAAATALAVPTVDEVLAEGAAATEAPVGEQLVHSVQELSYEIVPPYRLLKLYAVKVLVATKDQRSEFKLNHSLNTKVTHSDPRKRELLTSINALLAMKHRCKLKRAVLTKRLGKVQNYPETVVRLQAWIREAAAARSKRLAS